MQVRAVLATDEDGLAVHLAATEFTRCTSGVRVETTGTLPKADGRWSDFILEIHSSGQKNVDGTLRLYVDGGLVATAVGEFGFPQTPGRALQYFKIGIYRDSVAAWGDAGASIEVRNIRRGGRPEEVGLPAEDALVA